MNKPKLPENKFFIEDPSSFINLFVRKLIKGGNVNKTIGMIYNLLLSLNNKETGSSSLLVLENLIKSLRMSLRPINFKLRGKYELVPGLVSTNFSRNETIKSLINPASPKNKNTLKTIFNFLFSEVNNLKTNTSVVKKQNITAYSSIRKKSYLANKIFKANKKQIFKNATTPKKKFFTYI